MYRSVPLLQHIRDDDSRECSVISTYVSKRSNSSKYIITNAQDMNIIESIPVPSYF